MSDTSSETSSDTPRRQTQDRVNTAVISSCAPENAAPVMAPRRPCSTAWATSSRLAGLTSGPLRVKRTRASCFAACKGGPIVWCAAGRHVYYNVTPENMDRIIEQHLRGGRPVEDLVFHQAECGDGGAA